MGQSYYPLMLQLQGKRCVIAGGGKVAERKLLGLLEAGADQISVIAPEATDCIKGLAAQGIIELLSREYREEDARFATLLFAATDSKEDNRSIAADGRRYGAFVQLTDDGEGSDFITPSVVRRGSLLLAVSTGGTSPALTSMIRRELEEQYGESYMRWTARLGELRSTVYKELSGEPRGKLHAILRLAAEDAMEAARLEQDNKHQCYNDNFDLGEWLSSLLHRMDRRLF